MKRLLFLVTLFAAFSVYGQVDTIDIGTTDNDGTGDTWRVSFGKSNTADLLLEDRLDSVALVVTVADSTAVLTAVVFNPVDTATATEGTIYYDADTNKFYGRNNSAWVLLDTQ